MQAANVYPQSIYDLQKSLMKVMYGLLGLALFVFIAGLYSSKIVVLEMIGMFQLSYFGLLTLNFSDPLTTPLYSLKFTNGFNDILVKTQGNAPDKVYAVGIDSYLFANFNVAFFLSLTPLLITLILCLVWRKYSEYKNSNRYIYKASIETWYKITMG